LPVTWLSAALRLMTHCLQYQNNDLFFRAATVLIYHHFEVKMALMPLNGHYQYLMVRSGVSGRPFARFAFKSIFWGHPDDQ
jgi:hypothetical protein